MPMHWKSIAPKQTPILIASMRLSGFHPWTERQSSMHDDYQTQKDAIVWHALNVKSRRLESLRLNEPAMGI
jgi:hypothetical protein